ncbi:hypothetical protein N656DRAFT_266161 [Canariomyces notabilis]|uniref:Uncharacterized protein n=1 Tax=Canariomyces notabilis TaxID=2074819 RepID=A0AAN6TLL5_9PEZI|nr:hypothetical protein N656DRAFT_266161 [Canariomyces arenarius]
MPGMASNKITKTKGKMVKPILKKLSHSEKNSLDLDRGWDEQSVEQLENSGGNEFYAPTARDVSFGFLGGYGAVGDAGVVGSVGSGFRAKFQHGRSGSQASTGSGPRGAFVHPFAQTPRTATPPLSYANSLASFDNNNTHSGRDHSPTITENEDDDEFDATTTYSQSHSHSHARSHTHTHTHHHPHLHHPSDSQPPPPPPSISQSTLRRSSINTINSGHRTPSFPETQAASKPPSLRINTGRSVSGTSRLAHGSGSGASSIPNASRSDLHLSNNNSSVPHLNLSVSISGTLDSPTGSLGGGSSTILSTSTSQQQQSQATQSQMSPLRSSLDLAFPRLRSRSELDTAARAENIRAARRKFEERERAKEEKHDREMIRKRERRDTKEAKSIEKGETVHHRKVSSTSSSTSAVPDSGGGPGGGVGLQKAGTWTAGGRNSPRLMGSRKGSGAWGGSGVEIAEHQSQHRSSPFLGRGAGGFASSSAPAGTIGSQHHPHHHQGLGIGLGRKRHTASPAPDAAMTGAASTVTGEKQMGFASRKYESVPLQTPPAFGPGVDDVRFEQTRPRRGSGAKRKTQSYWQGFLLWLRTKLWRLGGH